jgi:predicted P-loop ATPase/GTPase
VIQGLLSEIDEGAAHRRYRENEQQRADELGLKIPQAAVSADTSLQAAHTYSILVSPFQSTFMPPDVQLDHS